MDDVSLDRLATVATTAVRAAGEYLLAEFREGKVDADYGPDDVKAAADRAAEARIRSVIRESFPDHVVDGEESAREGNGDYVWVIDPLDGTNNFASGLPAFAAAVAVVHDGEPVVAAIYEPLPDSLYLAKRGAGATVDGTPLRAERRVALDRGTVSFVLGLEALRDPTLAAEAETIRDRLEADCKRVVQTWAPTVDWGLLARGAIEGIVCFHPDRYEQYAGELLAAESGVVAYRTESVYVGAGDGETLAALRDLVGV